MLQVNATVVAALRRRRHGGDRRPSQPRQRRRASGSATRCPLDDDSALAQVARTSAPARIDDWGGGTRRGALPHRLPLDRRRADRGQRRALGRGRRSRASTRCRRTPRTASARFAELVSLGRRLRAGAHGPDRLARPAREGRRRAAPPARAQPARRRAGAAGLASRCTLRVARASLASAARGGRRACSRRPRASSTPASPSCARSPAACTRRVLVEHGLQRALEALDRAAAGAGRRSRSPTSACPTTSRRPSTTSSPRR